MTCTFVLGLVFIGLGILSLVFFTVSHEYEFRYDDVCPVSPERCAFNITIDEDLEGIIVLQYKLTNFHQNHRRFIYSRIAAQYAGQYVDWEGLVPARPYRSINDSRNESDWILPSGAFACFAFNDTFVWRDGLNFDEQAIVYPSETGYLYRNLSDRYVGHRWLRDNDAFPGGETDPHFVRWMRIAASKTVIKEYGVCVDCKLPSGHYTIDIHSRYPPELFGGTKAILITEKTRMGDRSLYLVVVLFVLGGVLVAFAAFLFLAEFLWPRRARIDFNAVDQDGGGQEAMRTPCAHYEPVDGR